MDKEKNLFYIDPPGEDRPPELVSKEILNLYRKDFNMTTAKLCKLFRCERQWVEDTLSPHLRYIKLTSFFRRYLVEKLGGHLTAQEMSDLQYSVYLFSRQDVIRMFQENASADQKTTVVDLSDYCMKVSPKEFSEIFQDISKRKFSYQKKIDYLDPYLNEEGRRIYRNYVMRNFEWVPVSLPKLSFTEHDVTRLRTTADVIASEDLHTNTTAYKYLVDHGAIRIHLFGKVLWYYNNSIAAVPIPIQKEGNL